MISDRKIATVLRQYIASWPNENGQGVIRQLLKRKKNLSSRKNFLAHVTVSAVVLNHSRSRILLIQHKTLNKFIQPGGHLELNDASLVAAAQRELREETGLSDVVYLPYSRQSPELPFDINVHPIPANAKKNEPDHYHIDCRYLFYLADQKKTVIDSAEVTIAEWVSIKHAGRLDTGFARLMSKTQKLISRSTDEIFFGALIRHLDFSKVLPNLVVVVHILPDIPNFITALKSFAGTVTIIPKPNSIDTETFSKLKREKIVRTTRLELLNESTLEKLFPPGKQSCVLDIGGYFANETVMRWNKKNKRIGGIIEDTENGLHKYLLLKKRLTMPVISVARSPLKNNEDDLVGYNVAYYTETILRSVRFFPRYMTCGLIGYGKIGRGIAKYLFNQNIKPLIFDRDPVRMVEAYKDGCIPISKAGILASSDLLFCATGAKSLDENDFLNLKIGGAVASVTSSDDEFRLDNIHKHFSFKKVNRFITRLENSTRHFYLLNNGNAVNFLGGDQVGDFIRLVQAEIITGFKLLSLRRFSTGIHQLSDRDRRWIANNFLATYLQLE